MKKAIAIIVLGLLWCNVGFAEIIDLTKCRWTKAFGNEITWSTTWESFNRQMGTTSKEREKNLFPDGTFEDLIYSIDSTNGTVTKLYIYTDNFANIRFKQDLKWWNGLPEDVQKGYPTPKLTKYRSDKYTIIDFAGGVVEAEEVRWSKKTISINLKNGKVQYNSGTFDEYTCLTPDETIASGQTGSSGTAFFIDRKGHLLTNNHVIEGCKVSKINYFNEEYDTKLIATDKTLDLALLKATVRPRSYISFSKNEPKKRQTITAAGYPLGKFLSDDLKINDGRISSLKGFENNSNEITVDIAINPGNSGGPIVNEKGQLVAIAVAGMAKDMTEGLNFGIKASAAANFLKSNKISPSVGYMNFSMGEDKLVKLLEESTVYTFCE